MGILNQLRMAEITEIGVIGKNGLLIHSQYGSRLMLGGLLTTASLPVKRYPDIDEPGCPSDCQICSDACPVNAIIPERKQVKIMRCLNYTARIPAISKLKLGQSTNRLRPVTSVLLRLTNIHFTSVLNVYQLVLMVIRNENDTQKKISRWEWPPADLNILYHSFVFLLWKSLCKMIRT